MLSLKFISSRCGLKWVLNVFFLCIAVYLLNLSAWAVVTEMFCRRVRHQVLSLIRYVPISLAVHGRLLNNLAWTRGCTVHGLRRLAIQISLQSPTSSPN